MVDYLVRAGALVGYRTVKHGRTAIEWAKLMNIPVVVRILDLGRTVQYQLSLIFNAISCGNLELVKKTVGDGDFFDPNGDGKIYKEMESYVAEAQACNDEVRLLKNQMSRLTNDVEKVLTHSLDYSLTH
jgi:hypothetical protein